MLRQNQACADNDDEIDSDVETPCSAPSCKINSIDNVVINWIGCESCDRWYHLVCVGLGDKSENEIRQLEYTNKC